MSVQIIGLFGQRDFHVLARFCVLVCGELQSGQFQPSGYMIGINFNGLLQRAICILPMAQSQIRDSQSIVGFGKPRVHLDRTPKLNVRSLIITFVEILLTALQKLIAAELGITGAGGDNAGKRNQKKKCSAADVF